jgi:hypothetical protein
VGVCAVLRHLIRRRGDGNIDPKDDLGNLLLTFPDLWPEDFALWVEGGDPAAVAKDWAAGLSRWGIGPERIVALQDAR